MADNNGPHRPSEDDASSPGPPAGIRSVQRALDLLALFDERQTWSLSELARAIELPKTTVARLLRTLADADMLWVRPDTRVTVGAGLLRWARLAGDAWEMLEPARARMRALAQSSGEAVNVYVRQGTSRVCIAAFDGPQNPRYVMEVGVRLALTRGCVSQVLLSDAPTDIFDTIAARAVDKEAWTAEMATRLADLQSTGYAVSHGTRDGVSGVAAPIRDTGGHIIAAVAIAGPTARFTAEKIPEFGRAVAELCQDCPELGLPRALTN